MSSNGSSFSISSCLISGCSDLSSDKASLAKLLVGFWSGVLLVLFDGRTAIPLFETWPLYIFSNQSSVSYRVHEKERKEIKR